MVTTGYDHSIFRLYDVDASGSINLKEISTIMETMDQVEGRGDILIQDESGGLRSVAKRADEIFGMLDVDHDGEITMEEFVEGYLKIHSLARDPPPEKPQENKKAGRKGLAAVGASRKN